MFQNQSKYYIHTAHTIENKRYERIISTAAANSVVAVVPRAYRVDDIPAATVPLWSGRLFGRHTW